MQEARVEGRENRRKGKGNTIKEKGRSVNKFKFSSTNQI